MLYFALLGFNPETLQLQIQYSARTAFLIFSIAFSADPLFIIWGRNFTNWLVSNKKYLGVSFAFIHYYHLSLIILKNNVYEPVFNQINVVSLLVGIIVYLFIGFILISSFPVISKHLNEKNWPKLHAIGGYSILFVFTILYFYRMTQEIMYLPSFIIALIVWVLRLIFKKFIRN